MSTRLCCVAFVLIGIADPAAAANLVIGHVTNETRSQPQPGCPVFLIRHDAETETIRQDTTDGQGRFSFQVQDGNNARWFLSATYGGVNYAQRVEDGPNEIVVYETTDSDTAISVAAHHIIVDAAQKKVEQILIVQNEGNRTFKTGEGHGHGLEVFLPEGVTEITGGPQGLHTHGDILVNPDPVRPGRSQLVFTFDLPPSGRLSQSLSYPTGAVDVLVHPSGADITGGALQDQGEVTFEQHSFRRFSGAGFNRGDKIDLRIRPEAWSVSGLLTGIDLKWTLLGLAIGFALLAIFFRPTGKPRAPARTTAERKPGFPVRRNVLLHQIADLDERYEKGRLSKEDYQTRRNAFKAELVEMSRLLEGEA